MTTIQVWEEMKEKRSVTLRVQAFIGVGVPGIHAVSHLTLRTYAISSKIP